MGVFTATRFLAILTAGILNPAVGIFISLFIIFVGSLVLVFTQQISAAAVWAGVILQAVNTFNFTYKLYYVRAYSGVKNGNFSLFLVFKFMCVIRLIHLGQKVEFFVVKTIVQF